MSDDDRPSTETTATPTPPKGRNVKALVTPGDDAEREARDEEEASPAGAKRESDDREDNPGDLPNDAPATIAGLAG